MRSIWICVVGLVAVAWSLSESEYTSAFKEWSLEHEKVYSEEDEFLYRLRVFSRNLELINEHNSQESSFTMGLNQFSDLTNTEFMERVGGFRQNENEEEEEEVELYVPESGQALPSSIDWRTKGVVTGVKNQGSCGSCWAFSSTGVIEGAWALNHSLVSLSEQNLMDCSHTTYGNNGCGGGNTRAAIKYVRDNKGIDTEASYPYEKQTTYNCRYSSANKGASISSYQGVESGSESALQKAVAYRGPVSVAIDASQPSFQSYKSGVYYEPNCSSSKLDHAVLVVGYGTGSQGDYWIVKNSWGTGWGDKGYIYMARNKNNNCGIATYATFVIL